MNTTIINVVADCQSYFNMSCYAVNYVLIKNPCPIYKKHLNIYKIIFARYSLENRVGGMWRNDSIISSKLVRTGYVSATRPSQI